VNRMPPSLVDTCRRHAGMARTVMTGMTSNVRALRAPYVLLLLFSSRRRKPLYADVESELTRPTNRREPSQLYTAELPSPQSQPSPRLPCSSPPPLLLPFQPPNYHLPNRILVQQQETKSNRLIVTVKLLMVHYDDDCRLVLVIHSVTVELLMVYY
jgi:hypothetical protein